MSLIKIQDFILVLIQHVQIGLIIVQIGLESLFEKDRNDVVLKDKCVHLYYDDLAAVIHIFTVY